MTTTAGSPQIVPESPAGKLALRAADQGVADALESVLSDVTSTTGATCWADCRKTRAPSQWHCWAGCKRRNRIDSAGRTCVRCSSGEASWPTIWSMPRPKQRCWTPMECRKQR